MPILDDTTLTHHTIGGTAYGFSATRIDTLGACEWTLVGIVADSSGSIQPFKSDIERCITEVVQACHHSPRVDNMMLRYVTFDSKLKEVHGFRPLSRCAPDDYTDSIRAYGSTALYDAAHNTIEAIRIYGHDLAQQDFEANAILFVITDGQDNTSSLSPSDVRDALARTIQSEDLESLCSILIGVNVHDPSLSSYLQNLHTQAGFTRYVELPDASANTLAKLAEFVSRSIAIQSQSLANGSANTFSLTL